MRKRINVSATLQLVDLTNLIGFLNTSWRKVACLPSTTGRVEMKIHPKELFLVIREVG